MPLPSIFTEGTAQDEKLARYFEEMYEYLLEEGVPEDRLPSPWHMLSRMVKCIDPEIMRDWLDAYVAVETEAEGGEGDDDDSDEADLDLSPEPERPQRPKMKRRPSYLRAILNDEDDKTDDPDASEEGATPTTQTDGS
jgi:hypothetical protein